MKILWLSRHAMTPEQQSALQAEMEAPLEILHRNATFPASSMEALEMIISLAKVEGAAHVAGVFPAHIAAQYARWAEAWEYPMLLIPVSVPAPAVEGEARGGGFVFSHWEMF